MSLDVSATNGRSSTTADATTRQQSLKDVNAAISDASAQTASGRKSGGYNSEAMAEKTRLVLSKVQAKKECEAANDKASLITGRITLGVGATQSMRKIKDAFHELVTVAQNGVTGDATFGTKCEGLLKQLQSVLNKKDFDGQSLFGGDATDRDAVNLDDAPLPGPDAFPSNTYTQYFKGDDRKHTTTIHGETVDYGFSAKDPGIRDLIFWLKSGTQTTPNGDPNSDSGRRLKGMQDGLHTVTKQLESQQKDLGTQLENVERISKDVTAELTYTDQTLHELTDADMLAQLIKHHQELLQQQMLMSLQTRDTSALTKMIDSI